jgi:hypothetical protein
MSPLPQISCEMYVSVHAADNSTPDAHSSRGLLDGTVVEATDAQKALNPLAFDPLVRFVTGCTVWLQAVFSLVPLDRRLSVWTNDAINFTSNYRHSTENSG